MNEELSMEEKRLQKIGRVSQFVSSAGELNWKRFLSLLIVKGLGLYLLLITSFYVVQQKDWYLGLDQMETFSKIHGVYALNQSLKSFSDVEFGMEAILSQMNNGNYVDLEGFDTKKISFQSVPKLIEAKTGLSVQLYWLIILVSITVVISSYYFTIQQALMQRKISGIGFFGFYFPIFIKMIMTMKTHDYILIKQIPKMKAEQLKQSEDGIIQKFFPHKDSKTHKIEIEYKEMFWGQYQYQKQNVVAKETKGKK